MVPLGVMESAERKAPMIARATVPRVGEQDVFMLVVADPIAATIRLHQIARLATKAAAALYSF